MTTQLVDEELEKLKQEGYKICRDLEQAQCKLDSISKLRLEWANRYNVYIMSRIGSTS